MSKRWEKLRPEIDEAIRAGLTAYEFRELHNIKMHEWSAMKPKGFHWRSIQSKLNITPKPNPEIKPEKPKIKLSFYDQRLIQLSLDLHKSLCNNGHTPKVHEIIDELYDLNQFILRRGLKDETDCM